MNRQTVMRDWWATDWVWSVLHLRDATHLQGVDLPLAGTTVIGVGYIQRPGEPVTEMQAVTAQETFADDRLPRIATLMLDPAELEVVGDIRGHPWLRLVASDGRMTQFTPGLADGQHFRQARQGWLSRVEP
jgi:hypothetical protein